MKLTDFVRVLDTLITNELQKTTLIPIDQAIAKQTFVIAANKALAEALKE